MASFSLDDIREAADLKYASTDIALGDGETVVMVNPLRLSKEKRKELMSIQDIIDGEEEIDQEDVLRNAIRLVSEDEGPAEKLIELVGDDLGVLAEIFSKYTEKNQVGEASASQS